LPAQHRPDLSGTWAAVSDAPSGATPAPSPLFAARFALRHRGETLTMTRLSRNESIERTFTIGGGETHVRVPGRLCEGDAATFEKVA
jgi:hypothetical protein